MELSTKSQAELRPAGEMWRSILLQIPTVFGRLVFLSSLRAGNGGRYSHPVLARMLGGEDADRTLRHSHHQVFMQWIGSSLKDQKDDLDEYVKTGGEGQDVLRRYLNLIPPTATEVERQLYSTDLETLLELLRYQPAAASRIPAALPRQ